MMIHPYTYTAALGVIAYIAYRSGRKDGLQERLPKPSEKNKTLVSKKTPAEKRVSGSKKQE